MKEAYFAAGCFWGIQKTFDEIKCGIKTEVGYCGTPKLKKKPTYEEISQGNTNYSEAIKIKYDRGITYRDLCKYFFYSHDFTKKKIPQYKSAIFYKSPYQKKIALEVKKEFEASYSVATEILPFDQFYKAESYHQKYYQKMNHSMNQK